MQIYIAMNNSGLNFGEAYGVQIESEKGKYTKVRLSLPVIHPEDEVGALAVDAGKTEEKWKDRYRA